MKSNISVIATLTAVLPLLTSCDDFLDVRPKSEKVERDLFSNADGFEAAIYGVYGSMASNVLYGRNLLWGVTDVMAQDLSVNTTEMNALASFRFEENNDLRTRFAYIWSNAYQVIGYANNILTNIERRGGGLPLRNIYRGEMLAVRAYLHFDLLRLFCSTDTTRRGIPYPTAYVPIMNDFNTVGRTFRLILADLGEAERLLREAADVVAYPRDNSHYYKFQRYQEEHANYYAVLGILAKVHWTMGNMAEAARYARMVIDSGKFPLAEPSEVPDLFAGKLSDKETLWGLSSTTYNETAQSYLYNFQSFYSYDPYTSTSGATTPQPYQTVYSRNVESTVQDYRLQWFRLGTSYARLLKVCDYHTLDGGTGIPAGWNDRLSGINMLHVSELYLIAADALLDSDPAAALTLYNAETASRGLPARRQEQGLTHDIIFEEYHKEMFGEGQVWYNMKRRNMDIVSNRENRTVPASESVYTIPIPQDEIAYRN